MKKTLLVAALTAGFACVAQAQSTNVTLYGRVDGGVGYTQYKDKNAGTNASKASKFGAENGVQTGNRWGLRGSEDLGNGLKVSFILENGFELYRGTAAQDGRLFGRQAIIALSSDDWGRLEFGRGYNVADGFVPSVAMPQGDAFKEGAAGSSFTSISRRADNLLKYTSPDFSGFQFGIGYSFQQDGPQPFDVKGSTDVAEKLLTLGLRYKNGPLTVAASYDQFDGVSGDPNANPSSPYVRDAKDIKSWILAASYDFDVVKLHLGIGQDRNGVMAGRTAHNRALPRTLRNQSGFGYLDGYKTNNYSVGFTIPLASGDVRLGWQSARLGSGAYKANAATEKHSQNKYTAIYTYPFSKRTNAYAVATYGTGYAFSNVTVTQAIVGLRHDF